MQTLTRHVPGLTRHTEVRVADLRRAGEVAASAPDYGRGNGEEPS